MRERILPPEEWPRLAGTEAETMWPHMDPEKVRVMVVEDDAGEIAATWTLVRVVHAEFLWVAPKYRGIFGVVKRLLRIMRRTADSWNVSAVFTGAKDEHVADLIRRFGGAKLPFDSYVLPTQHAKAGGA